MPVQSSPARAVLTGTDVACSGRLLLTPGARRTVSRVCRVDPGPSDPSSFYVEEGLVEDRGREAGSSQGIQCYQSAPIFRQMALSYTSAHKEEHCLLSVCSVRIILLQ